MLQIKIVTAHPLASSTFSKIKKSVEKKYGKDVSYIEEEDQSVIGGIRIIVGQKEVDFTVNRKIDKIIEQLSKNI